MDIKSKIFYNCSFFVNFLLESHMLGCRAFSAKKKLNLPLTGYLLVIARCKSRLLGSWCFKFTLCSWLLFLRAVQARTASEEQIYQKSFSRLFCFKPLKCEKSMEYLTQNLAHSRHLNIWFWFALLKLKYILKV